MRQPGDQEDKQGRPFVGPAGRVLDRALDEAGIDRAEVYLTNAVKHFKWTERGKRRIHQRPNGTEIKACGFWLDAEIGLVRPRLLVLLGAVAGEAVFGSRFRVGEHKGKVEEAGVRAVAGTGGEHHPSVRRAARGRPGGPGTLLCRARRRPGDRPRGISAGWLVISGRRSLLLTCESTVKQFN